MRLLVTKSDIDKCEGFIKKTQLMRYYKDATELRNDLFSWASDHSFMIYEGSLSGVIYGCAVYCPKGVFHNFPYIKFLCVDPQYHNKGVGKFIMSTIETHALSSGYDKIFLAVADFNPGAYQFYSKRDYIKIGTIPDTWVEGVDDHLMMKKLTEEGVNDGY